MKKGWKKWIAIVLALAIAVGIGSIFTDHSLQASTKSGKTTASQMQASKSSKSSTKVSVSGKKDRNKDNGKDNQKDTGKSSTGSSSVELKVDSPYKKEGGVYNITAKSKSEKLKFSWKKVKKATSYKISIVRASNNKTVYSKSTTKTSFSIKAEDYLKKEYKLTVKAMKDDKVLSKKSITFTATIGNVVEKKENNDKTTIEPTQEPTASLTETPAEAPVEEPTEAPAEKPTEAPAEEPTEAPAEKPTEAPVEEPTEAPVEKPTEAPVEKPTEAPAEDPTEAPVEKPTEAPAEEPSEAPVEKPTEAPVEEPTEAPVEKPTEAPAEEPFTGRASVVMLNRGQLKYGDTVTLAASVMNANKEYTIRWECDEGNGWKTVGFGTEYSFTLTRENAADQWRAVLVTDE